MRLGKNIRKMIDFRRAGADDVSLIPRPWRNSEAPYYLVKHLSSRDGHGEYTRLYEFDRDGIPFVRRSGRPWYEALAVARYAMRMLQVAKRLGDAAAREKARRQIPALVQSGARNGFWSVGSSPGRMSEEGPSAIVQGVVLSALIRLHRDAPDERAKTVIERGFDVFATPVEEGGVLSRLGSGPFLEEYPSEPPSHVLNGCLYALFALYDLADAMDHAPAARLAAAVEGTLARELKRFVTDSGWSYYALALEGRPSIASIHYHRHHVFMLRVVAERTADVRVARILEAWSRTLHSRRARMLHALNKTYDVLVRRRAGSWRRAAP